MIAVAMEMRLRHITSFGTKQLRKSSTTPTPSTNMPSYSLTHGESGSSFHFTSADAVPALSTKAMCAAAARHFDRYTNHTRVVNTKEIYTVLQSVGEEHLVRHDVEALVSLAYRVIQCYSRDEDQPVSSTPQKYGQKRKFTIPQPALSPAPVIQEPDDTNQPKHTEMTLTVKQLARFIEILMNPRQASAHHRDRKHGAKAHAHAADGEDDFEFVEYGDVVEQDTDKFDKEILSTLQQYFSDLRIDPDTNADITDIDADITSDSSDEVAASAAPLARNGSAEHMLDERSVKNRSVLLKWEGIGLGLGLDDATTTASALVKIGRLRLAAQAGMASILHSLRAATSHSRPASPSVCLPESVPSPLQSGSPSHLGHRYTLSSDLRLLSPLHMDFRDERKFSTIIQVLSSFAGLLPVSYPVEKLRRILGHVSQQTAACSSFGGLEFVVPGGVDAHKSNALGVQYTFVASVPRSKCAESTDKSKNETVQSEPMPAGPTRELSIKCEGLLVHPRRHLSSEPDTDGSPTDYVDLVTIINSVAPKLSRRLAITRFAIYRGVLAGVVRIFHPHDSRHRILQVVAERLPQLRVEGAVDIGTRSDKNKVKTTVFASRGVVEVEAQLSLSHFNIGPWLEARCQGNVRMGYAGLKRQLPSDRVENGMHIQVLGCMFKTRL